jgi:CrcB protein
VNVVGCFLIGVISQWLPPANELAGLRLLLVTGFLGGLTTFSAFGHDTFVLLGSKPGLALANVGLNVGCGLLAVWLGVASWRYFAG